METGISPDEAEILKTFFRQMELGRIAEWSGLEGISKEEFCGWMLMIYSMLDKDPHMRARMSSIGALHLKDLQEIDQKLLSSLSPNT